MKTDSIWIDQDHQHFLLFKEFGSLSAVARKTGKDLGSLSRSLSRLEKIHGELFVRIQSGLRATSQGEDLYRALTKARESFVQAAIDKVSNIRIGFSPPVGFGFFCEFFFPHLSELNLRPDFTMAPSLELFEKLKNRQLDFIISPRTPEFPGIISSPMFTTKLALCSRSGKLARKLIRSDQLFDLEKRLKGLTIDDTLIVNDYFISAKLLAYSDEYMGILPECILSNFPELVIHDHPFFEEKVYAITWKGSPGVELLKRAKRK